MPCLKAYRQNKKEPEDCSVLFGAGGDEGVPCGRKWVEGRGARRKGSAGVGG